jgi:cytochrome c biogenesis protein CcdA
MKWRKEHRPVFERIVNGVLRHSGWDISTNANAERTGVWKPFFRLKSYGVGTVRGLAGSATLMLLVLASIKSVWDGVTYILLFGLGTAVSMSVISIFISVPFTVSGRVPRVNRTVKISAGSLSIIFGAVLMYEVGVGQGLPAW